MQIDEAVTNRIQQLLKERGWTPNELIKRSGINQSTISEIMAGRSKFPRISTIQKIAHGFGMTLSEFFDHDMFEE
ncbi:helix-turn-helix domain-containing protein [Planococcus sp. 4-30]|uniref:helix-turn-helix domain-containing protein n=1 Tax=Planococcus sp. 4-30 TaxID=2874583 RepID=UPI001CC0673F|nr:helix-turn-helix transcriptional regulator [Planococcus sp. 4-30]